MTQPPAAEQSGPIDGSGTDRARCVLAPNPSPMTLDGTNTWLIAEPGSAAAIVIDPGPQDEGHLRRGVWTTVPAHPRSGVRHVVGSQHPAPYARTASASTSSSTA